jgi:hypothetical protein
VPLWASCCILIRSVGPAALARRSSPTFCSPEKGGERLTLPDLVPILTVIRVSGCRLRRRNQGLPLGVDPPAEKWLQTEGDVVQVEGRCTHAQVPKGLWRLPTEFRRDKEGMSAAYTQSCHFLQGRSFAAIA